MSPIRVSVFLFSLATSAAVCAAEITERELSRQFSETVQPFLQANCLQCHGQNEPEGELVLSSDATMADVVKRFAVWKIVLERLEAKEMPPAESKRQPSAEERTAVVRWIKALGKFEAERNAGDPGPVLARRLSNAEYDYTIRDLTGVDIRPTAEFPIDPANEAGFDNSGESLSMSPALLGKYLAAARQVAEHLVLKPEGIAFAPHPVVTDTDRDKYCVRRIVDFYERQPTDYADYFVAAWQFKHRAALGKPDQTLAGVAAEAEVSPKYLAAIWDTLTAQDSIGPIAKVQAMWRALPAPEPSAGEQTQAVRRGCEAMRDHIVQLRAKLAPEFENLRVRGMHAGSQSLVLWKNRQYAEHRMKLNRDALQVEGRFPLAAEIDRNDEGEPAQPDAVQREKQEPSAGDQKYDDAKKDRGKDDRRRRRGKDRRGRDNDERSQPPAPDPELTIPSDPPERDRHIAAFERFCRIFPDAFYIRERGRVFLEGRDQQEKGRLLSAGFHSMMGYFRDDAPLCELILDDAQRQELDRLWQELDFIAAAPIRQHTGFIWFERTDSRFMISEEFDFARAEDKDATSQAKIEKLAEVYLAKARDNGGSEVALKAIDDHFRNINASIRWVEQTRLAAEPSHLATLADFAERAYRRPLAQAERDDLVAFYRTLRDNDGLSHADALRDTLASVLVSPYFCYRIDLVEEGQGPRPLDDYALASRLSYFLWSSMPDQELLNHAAAGDLRRPEVLAAQARRLLADDRVRGLATEFGGNWLDIRRFQQHNSVDRQRFPNFTNDLRQAMFEEPIRFFVDLVKRDRSVLDFVYAEHTLVNPVLARHYGMPDEDLKPGEWARIDDASQYGRGGLLPMAVFLTSNSPGLRTSPVKRGYWVVRRLLGEHIPPPPPDVPELPADEAALGKRTLREMLAMHREHPNCAACHVRFDSVGLVFEGYGPVGERRTKDLGGRDVDTFAVFPTRGDKADGKGSGVEGSDVEGSGVEGLKAYLREHRQDEFVDNLCRKLLSYALGRTLIPSDEATIAEMRAALAANNHRFGSLIETIVNSPQFLNKRSQPILAEE